MTTTTTHDAHVIRFDQVEALRGAFYQNAVAAYWDAQSKLQLILRGMSYVAALDGDNIRREQALRVCAAKAHEELSRIDCAAVELKFVAQYAR